MVWKLKLVEILLEFVLYFVTTAKLEWFSYVFKKCNVTSCLVLKVTRIIMSRLSFILANILGHYRKFWCLSQLSKNTRLNSLVSTIFKDAINCSIAALRLS
ncbi:hypothetical protein BpHYR1_051179 [Brachionus plicatilis]|uniref:Uncharacterized protein n=1 Tax=Brachionus plicatilis TaxID=10195 RepID=A0A3M7S1M7_BRAPC|nr:hypothetical protein BpHYR1_051179 [Brachionus plicatilis]